MPRALKMPRNHALKPFLGPFKPAKPAIYLQFAVRKLRQDGRVLTMPPMKDAPKGSRPFELPESHQIDARGTRTPDGRTGTILFGMGRHRVGAPKGAAI